MTEMVPFTGAALKGEPRALRRELARIDGQRQVGLAKIDQAADLQAARVAALGYVGKRAMHEVAMVSQLEQQLSSLVPISTARLQGLADMSALAMADVVGDTVRRVK